MPHGLLTFLAKRERKKKDEMAERERVRKKKTKQKRESYRVKSVRETSACCAGVCSSPIRRISTFFVDVRSFLR